MGQLFSGQFSGQLSGGFRIFILAIALLGAVSLVACDGAKETNPENLLPDGSTIIGEIRVAEIIDSPEIQALVESLGQEGQPQTVEGLVDLALTETGIDLRIVSEAWLFGDVSRNDTDFGVIAQGRFNEDSLVGIFQEREEVSTTEYKGRRLHSLGPPADALTWTFIEGDNLVIGSVASVRRVIDVQDGDLPAVSGQLRDTLNELGRVMFKVAVLVPPGQSEELFQNLGQVPFLGGDSSQSSAVQSALQDLTTVGIAINAERHLLLAKADLDFTRPESAVQVGNLLDGLLNVLRGLGAGDGAFNLLTRLQIDTHGPKLQLRLEVPTSELIDIARDSRSIPLIPGLENRDR